MILKFKFSAQVWVYPGVKASWYFVTVPSDITSDIKELNLDSNGFGSIKVNVTINDSAWSTSIFPDSKSSSYLLPIKKDIRKINDIKSGDIVKITLTLV